MPLIVLTGHPCSGKSTVAKRLCELLRPHGPVVVVDEPSLHLDRNTSYADSAHEKVARASLKSALERALDKRTYVVLDSLNAIKGYRYEVWCAARTAGTRYAVVHVDAPAEACRAWNAARGGGGGGGGGAASAERYDPAILDDLIGRFEPPDSRNRWDAPLFVVRPAGGDAAADDEALRAAAAVVAGAAAAPGAAAGAAGATGAALKPNAAAVNPGLLGTNVLHDVDAAAQAVVDAVAAAQQQQQQQLGGGGGGGLGGAGGVVVVDLPSLAGPGGGRGRDAQLRLERHVPLAELRRHKRAFLRLATKTARSRVPDAATAERLFADYLRQQIQQQDI